MASLEVSGQQGSEGLFARDIDRILLTLQLNIS